MIGCVGGGSNSIGVFIPFVDDPEVELIGVEAAGEGIETGRHGAPLTARGAGWARAGSCTARSRRSCRTRTARSSRPTRSRPGSTTPAPGPSTRGCRDTGRASYFAVTDQAGARGVRADRAARGDHPGARERPRPRLVARERTERARPDLPVGTRGQGPRRGGELAGASSLGSFASAKLRGATSDRGRADRRGVRIRPRRRPPGGADAVPDGRLPGPRHVAPDRPRLRGRGRRPGRARRPVLGSARRRAGDPRGGNGGASSRGQGPRRARGRRRRSPSAFRSWSCATRTRSSPAGSSGSRTRCSTSARAALIVPDLPLEEAPAALRACDERGLALVPLVAPTTPDERLARIGAQARGFLYTVSLTGTTGERAGVSRRAGGRGGTGRGEHRQSRSRSGSASPPPSRPRPPPTPAPTA